MKTIITNVLSWINYEWLVLGCYHNMKNFFHSCPPSPLLRPPIKCKTNQLMTIHSFSSSQEINVETKTSNISSSQTHPTTPQPHNLPAERLSICSTHKKMKDEIPIKNPQWGNHRGHWYWWCMNGMELASEFDIR